jgi:hypothetical protein
MLQNEKVFDVFYADTAFILDALQEYKHILETIITPHNTENSEKQIKEIESNKLNLIKKALETLFVSYGDCNGDKLKQKENYKIISGEKNLSDNYSFLIKLRNTKEEIDKKIGNLEYQKIKHRSKIDKLNKALINYEFFKDVEDSELSLSVSDKILYLTHTTKIPDVTLNYFKHQIRGGYFQIKISFYSFSTVDFKFARNVYTPYEINRVNHPHVSNSKGGEWGDCCFGSGEINDFIRYNLKYRILELETVCRDVNYFSSMFKPIIENYLSIYSSHTRPYFDMSTINLGTKKPIQMPSRAIFLTEFVKKHIIKNHIELKYSEVKGVGKFDIVEKDTLNQYLLEVFPMLIVKRDNNGKYFSNNSFLSKEEMEKIIAEHEGKKTEIYFGKEQLKIKIITDYVEGQTDDNKYINPYFKQRVINKLRRYVTKKAIYYFNKLESETNNTNTSEVTEQDLVHL